MADKTYEMALLYDFFGDLLTDKQREYFDYCYRDDLSLSEIAELTGVTRQGARETIVRAEKLLREYEEKTGVVARFREMEARVDGLLGETRRLLELTDGEARECALRLRAGLEELKG